MERLIYVPIERLQQRYTAQWDDWFQNQFQAAGIPFVRVGDSKERVITYGQFLDVCETNQYKAGQLSEILQLIQQCPDVPTTVFFLDIWFPGIQSLYYLREGLGLPIKVKGMIHAGTYDPWDFLTQKGMRKWGTSFEASVLAGADEVFCATKFHQSLIASAGLPTENFTIVDWPVEDQFAVVPKTNLVVFPHRLAPEKDPAMFDRMQTLFEAKYGDIASWVKTAAVCKSKDEYYNLLARAKVAVSCAFQETFGIAMVEAVNNGCIAVAPNRLSYPEVLGTNAIYNTLDQAVDMIYNGLQHYSRPRKLRGKQMPWIPQILA